MVRLKLKRTVSVVAFLVFICLYVVVRIQFLDLDGQIAPSAESESRTLRELATTTETVRSTERANAESCDNNVLGVPPSLSKCSDCKNFTCKKFLFSSVNDPIYAKFSKTSNVRNHQLLKPDFLQIANDCDYFKQSLGYHLKPVSGEEAKFPIAYNILMHIDVAQVELLLRAIYRPQNVYCIHLDAKALTSVKREMDAIIRCFPNVFLASKLERVIYAGYSRLQADINCMRDLYDHPIHWKYLINTAGQAFPLKSNAEIVKILKIYNGSNDIEGIYGRRVLRHRFIYEWEEVRLDTAHPGLNKTGRKNPPPPHDIDIVRGSAYGVFSKAFVKFILTDQTAKDLLQWSRKTWSPDEFYWATLHHTYSNPHLKTPGAFSGIPTEKKWLAAYSAWGGVDKCHGRWRHGSCVFGLQDLPLLMERRELFANKFDRTMQPTALECLTQWVEYKTQCPPGDSTYDFYRALPFVNQATF